VSNIIFDFDGTIADSFTVVVDTFFKMTGRSQKVSVAEIKRLRGLPMLRVAQELDVRIWKIPVLLRRGRRMIRSQMNQIEPFVDMPEVIRALHADGHHLYIMSSNSVQNIQAFLHQHNLNREFIRIYGSVGVLGKAGVLRKIIRHNRLDAADTYYVGDEVRDIAGAKHAHVKIVSVGWGYNSAPILRLHHPNYLAKKPDDILNFFK
jgi:phosphoglycolate phosphatase